MMIHLTGSMLSCEACIGNIAGWLQTSCARNVGATGKELPASTISSCFGSSQTGTSVGGRCQDTESQQVFVTTNKQNIILSDKLHHTSLWPFCMMAGIVPFPSVPVHHILVRCIAVNSRFVDTISKKVLEMFAFISQTLGEDELEWRSILMSIVSSLDLMLCSFVYKYQNFREPAFFVFSM